VVARRVLSNASPFLIKAKHWTLPLARCCYLRGCQAASPASLTHVMAPEALCSVPPTLFRRRRFSQVSPRRLFTRRCVGPVDCFFASRGFLFVASTPPKRTPPTLVHPRCASRDRPRESNTAACSTGSHLPRRRICGAHPTPGQSDLRGLRSNAKVFFDSAAVGSLPLARWIDAGYASPDGTALHHRAALFSDPRGSTSLLHMPVGLGNRPKTRLPPQCHSLKLNALNVEDRASD
jgi:hypothetical protein